MPMWAKVYKKSGILQNAAVLTVTSLILRTVGIFFRIYLSGKIGAEGMGLYQLILSVYTLASAFAAAGICTAVTRIVTDSLCHGNRATALRALRYAILISLLAAALSAGAVVAAAEPIARWFLKDLRAVPALKILTVSLPFMGISSCLKGYFIARRKVVITARAQMLEQAVRIGAIVWLLTGVDITNVQTACAAIMWGDALAESASCILLLCVFARDKKQLPDACTPAEERVMTTLMGIALPISATRYLNTALHTAENMLVPSCIAVFTASRQTALAQFGSLKGMAIPVLFFPASFLSAMGTVLIPEISEAAALGNNDRVRRSVEKVMYLTALLSLPIAAVFYMYAMPIGQFLYHSDEVGAIIKALSPILPAMYLETMAEGILKGLNQQVTSLWYTLIDSALRIALTCVLVPRTGMAGFLFVMTVSNVLVAMLKLLRLVKLTKTDFRWWQWVAAPLLSVGIGCVGARFAGRIAPIAALPAPVTVAVGAVILAAMYALLVFAFGTRRPIALQKS